MNTSSREPHLLIYLSEDSPLPPYVGLGLVTWGTLSPVIAASRTLSLSRTLALMTGYGGYGFCTSTLPEISTILPKGVKIHLYGVENNTARHVWLCEGEFDSLVLSQLGYPAVGVPGVSSFKPNWKYLFASADSVTIVMDGDEAGRRGANRIASILGEVCANLRLASLPQGKDITDIYLSNERHLRALVE